MSRIIGIDLGTTNSVVALLEGGEPRVIENADGSRTTPSVVAFTDRGDRLVGITAKRQAITNPRGTIFSIKRFMGRRHSEVAEEEKIVPYGLVGGPEEFVKVEVRGKQHTPPEISAMILQNLKDTAERYLSQKVTRAVITVPAYFNDSQRQATKDAGAIAGLEVMRIINEPTAASLAYGVDKKKGGKIAVFDLGGGTFDISILEVGEGVFEVRSTNGDTHLGGDDFDDVLMNHIADEFRRDQGIDLRKDQMALQRLKEAAEKAKCELSTRSTTEINLPFITADQSGPKHLQMEITRARFEQLIEPLVERTRKPCELALSDAKLRPADVDEVLLVGGSTRMPAIQNVVKEIFGKEPNRSMNPDEVVAMGAAIQAGIIAQDPHVKDLLLVDVTPLSLGIETLGGVMTKLIERNSRIPRTEKKIFTTAEDNQPSVEIHVLQGEREMASDNRTLGRFILDGIPPAPRGVPQIEVSFEIDANGILNVSARDLGTGKAQSIEIKSTSGLSEGEIERMRRAAEEHAGEDRRKRRLAEARNKADQVIYQHEKLLREHGSEVSEDVKKRVESEVEAVRKAKEGEDPEAIEKATETLLSAAHELSRKMYEAAQQQRQQQQQQQQQQEAGAPGGASAGQEGSRSGKEGERIIDADYEVKD